MEHEHAAARHAARAAESASSPSAGGLDHLRREVSDVEVIVVGDIHSDLLALKKAFEIAADLSALRLLCVGDLCWQPRTRQHDMLVRTIRDACRLTGVQMLLVDGNNDDAEDMRSGRPHGAPLPVVEGLWYAPRGSSWRWAGRRFAALGGAATFRREGRREGIDLFPGEEIGEQDMLRCLALGQTDVLVSHDTPYGQLLPGEPLSSEGAESRARLSQAAALLSPALSIHGHYHREYQAYGPYGEIVLGLGRAQDGLPSVSRLSLPALEISAC